MPVRAGQHDATHGRLAVESNISPTPSPLRTDPAVPQRRVGVGSSTTTTFDGYVETTLPAILRGKRPARPAARRYFRLLIGYFEGLDAKRPIAWRAADSFALRDFLAGVARSPAEPLDDLGTRRLIDRATHQRCSPCCTHFNLPCP